jgi:sulfite dehydrogenase (cytochrome) subunit B
MTGLHTKGASVALLVALAIASTSVGAKPIIYNLPEETARFQPNPGVNLAEANCLACHSADYISTQPPRQGKAFWQAEVIKMIKAYGAPIAEQDASKIVEYLAATY